MILLLPLCVLIAALIVLILATVIVTTVLRVHTGVAHPTPNDWLRGQVEMLRSMGLPITSLTTLLETWESTSGS